MQLRKSTIVLSLVLFSQILLSQNTKLDSLKKIAAFATPDCKVFDDISWEYVRINSDSSLFYIEKYKACADKNNIEEREYIYLNRQGNNKFILSELDSALFYFNSAKSKIDSKDPKYFQKILGIKNNLANVYLYQGKSSLARTSFMEGLRLSKEANDTTSIIKFNINIGATYQMDGVMDSASIHMIKALKISEQIKFNDYHSFIHNNLCSIFSDLKQHEKSIYYCDKIISEKTSQGQFLATAYNTKAVALTQLSRYDEAEELLNKALNINSAPITNYHSYFTLCDLYLKKDDYNKAISYLLEARNEVKNTEHLLELASLDAKLAECYYKLNQYNNAESYSKKAIYTFQSIESKSKLYLQALRLNNESRVKQNKILEPEIFNNEKILRDSFNSVEILNNVNEIEQKYQSEKKEATNAALLKEQVLNQKIIKNQKSFLFALGIGLISFILLLINQLNRMKERKKYVTQLESKNNSIQTLNNEINHRTKNHLALATALLTKYKSKSQSNLVKAVITENENRLRALILVNKKLSNTSDHIEINIQDYLNELCNDLIFSLTHNTDIENVVLEIDCPNKKVDSEICLRIGLIANELITNSLKHSILTKGPLKLVLNIKKEGDLYKYTYFDNGTKATKSENSQYGLNLIKELTEQLNGIHTIILENNFLYEAKFPIASYT